MRNLARQRHALRDGRARTIFSGFWIYPGFQYFREPNADKFTSIGLDNTIFPNSITGVAGWLQPVPWQKILNDKHSVYTACPLPAHDAPGNSGDNA